jgi:hypothetical protein
MEVSNGKKIFETVSLRVANDEEFPDWILHHQTFDK